VIGIPCQCNYELPCSWLRGTIIYRTSGGATYDATVHCLKKTIVIVYHAKIQTYWMYGLSTSQVSNSPGPAALQATRFTNWIFHNGENMQMSTGLQFWCNRYYEGCVMWTEKCVLLINDSCTTNALSLLLIKKMRRTITYLVIVRWHKMAKRVKINLSNCEKTLLGPLLITTLEITKIAWLLWLQFRILHHCITMITVVYGSILPPTSLYQRKSLSQKTKQPFLYLARHLKKF
jgi:hypothetical protein